MKLPPEHDLSHSWSFSPEVQLRDWRYVLIQEVGNISRAAKAIGISRSQATRLMKKYKLIEFAAQLRLQTGARPSNGERKGVVGLGRPVGSKNRTF